jgi:hypothetical protein
MLNRSFLTFHKLFLLTIIQRLARLLRGRGICPIAMIAQCGRYRPYATSLQNDFVVEGEQRASCRATQEERANEN